ncbi:hypothetical protein Tco_1404511 [Tanacetum coccineum]
MMRPHYNHRTSNRQITDITYRPPLLALTDCPWTMTPAGNTYTRQSVISMGAEGHQRWFYLLRHLLDNDIGPSVYLFSAYNSIIEQKQMLAKSAQQHQEVCDLADAAEIYGTLSKVIDCDVKTYIVKSAESLRDFAELWPSSRHHLGAFLNSCSDIAQAGNDGNGASIPKKDVKRMRL